MDHLPSDDGEKFDSAFAEAKRELSRIDLILRNSLDLMPNAASKMPELDWNTISGYFRELRSMHAGLQEAISVIFLESRRGITTVRHDTEFPIMDYKTTIHNIIGRVSAEEEKIDGHRRFGMAERLRAAQDCFENIMMKILPSVYEELRVQWQSSTCFIDPDDDRVSEGGMPVIDFEQWGEWQERFFNRMTSKISQCHEYCRERRLFAERFEILSPCNPDGRVGVDFVVTVVAPFREKIHDDILAILTEIEDDDGEEQWA